MKLRLFIVSLLMIFLLTECSFAQEIYCCSVPDKLANPVLRGITNVIGLNLCAKKTAKVIIKKVLKRNADGEYDVKIDSFSAMDLKKGKFKSIQINGKNIASHGVYISSITMKSLCNYNYVEYNKNPVIFHTDLPLAFSAMVSEDDLNKSLINLGYIKKIMDLDFGGISLFCINNVEFKLKHNKIYLIVQVRSPLLMGERLIKFSFSGKLNVENGKIVLENLASENLRNINLGKFLDMLNEMNPFDMPLQIFKGNESTLCINNVRIIDNKICIDGIIVIKRSGNG